MVFFLFFSFVIFKGRPCLVRGLAGGADCSDGGTFSDHTKRCYKYYATPLPCTEARTQCADDNSDGDLASIPDQETNELVMSLLPQYGTYWIGGTDAVSEGVWQWSDGTPWSYTNWRRGQPDNDMGGQHHLYISGPSEGEVHGQWSDQQDEGANNRFMFICQY